MLLFIYIYIHTQLILYFLKNKTKKKLRKHLLILTLRSQTQSGTFWVLFYSRIRPCGFTLNIIFDLLLWKENKFKGILLRRGKKEVFEKLSAE